MTFRDYSKPLEWNYQKVAKGMAEWLQLLMNMAAAEAAGSYVRGVHRDSARTIYENWRHSPPNAGRLKA